MLRNLLPLTCAIVTLCADASGQQPVTDTMLFDLETTRAQEANSSEPVFLGAGGSNCWFSAVSRDHGRELWSTDGTLAGTRRLTDFAARLGDSDPASIAARISGRGFIQPSVLPNGTLLFAATVDGVGRELCAADPSGLQARVVADIHPAGDSDPGSGVLWQGAYWFLADDGQHGRELWTSDGTTAGTRLVDDVTPGPGSSFTGTENLIAGDGRLWFRPNGGAPALWVKDSPQQAARVVRGMAPFRESRLRAAGVAGGILFVNAEGLTGTEPWFSDGTAANTRLLVDLAPGSLDSQVEVVGGDGSRVWLQADVHPYGNELYVSDGTRNGTVLVRDIAPGTRDGLYSPTFALVDPGSGDLLFAADDTTGGAELFRSDGTAAGTRRVADVWPGITSSFPGDLAVVGSTLLFAADAPAIGRELFAYDLVGGTTTLLADIEGGARGSNPKVFAGTPNGVVLSAFTRDLGREPWAVQLGAGSARPLLDLFPGPATLGSDPYLIGRYRDRAIFAANVAPFGLEPWATDGTVVGTHLLADLEPGIGWSRPFVIGVSSRGLVFSTAGGRRRLMITDGTPAGTGALPGFDHGLPISDVDPHMAHDGRVYFRAEDHRGNNVWMTDGTAAGTRVLRNLSGYEFLAIREPLGPRLAVGIGGDPVVTGAEPWVTDGTLAGTRALGDLKSGPEPSQPTDFTELGAGVLFVADDGVHGRELWFTDGTPTGTVLLVDLEPGASGGNPHGLTRVGDRVVFIATTVRHGHEVWVTDGTAAGTRILVELVPGPDASLALYRPRSNGSDLAWFWTSIQSGVLELWVTDGTSSGTRMVGSSTTPGQSFRPTDLIPVGDGRHVAFVHSSAAFGEELWISDGTSAGTRPWTDSHPGPEGAAPDPNLDYDGGSVGGLRLGDRLLFTADDGAHGRELHAIPLGTAGAWVSSPYGTGCGQGLRSTGVPTLGRRFDLISSSPPGAAVSIAFGAAPAWTPYVPGCTVYLVPPILTVHAGIADPQGTVSLPLTIPNQVELVGVLLHFQGYHISGAGVLRSSNGLEVLVGR